MNPSRYLLIILLLFSTSSLFGQAKDPWAVKKQRTSVFQQPSFSFQTRNGANSSNSRQSSRVLKVGSKSSHSAFSVQGIDHEPPREIKGELSENARLQAPGKITLEVASMHYITQVKDLMQIAMPEKEFVFQKSWKDKLGNQHLRLQQQFQGVEIYGSEIIVHANTASTIQGLNGRYISSPQMLNTIPAIEEESAVLTALNYFEQRGALKKLDLKQQQLLNYSGPSSKLIILPDWIAEKPTLAWRVLIRPDFLNYWEVMVDAHSGKIINQHNLTCTFAPEIHTEGIMASTNHRENSTSASPFGEKASGQGNGIDLNGVDQSLNIWNLGDISGLIDASKDMFRSDNSTSVQDLEGVLITYDAENVPNAESFTIVNENGTTFSDPAAVSAHYNASIAYDYYSTMHNRTSIDGEGGNVISIVNIVEDDGSGLDNAYWNGAYMAYGNGNVAFKPLAGSIDVGGHEMSHGVISSTAALIYQDESGAINEHIADVFGVLIDIDNFTLGEDVVQPAVFTTGALRDMQNPHNGGSSLGDNGWQPDHMNEIYTGSQDNGGVHINSGIPNRAFYLLATDLGREVAGAIYYHALTTYLTASAEFSDLRRALINSANDLYGESEAQSVANAYDAVGITDSSNDPDGGNGGGENPVPDDEDEELPTIGGEDLLLTVNTDPNDGNSLYFINLSQDNFQPISVTSVQRKPTVVDDGSIAFFITEDETIHGIDLTDPFEEVVISDESLWANLSISKDGNRLAIISNQQQPEIWVADLTREENSFMRFDLFNPTSQDGVVTYDVQYADAIEWDYSGEYLIYDAFNSVGTTGLERDVEYWDVNFIKVWNNTTNDFGNGAITKIFSNLPEGTSIGNPSFSKTNRNIVCFDLFDANDESYSIIASNLSTGDTKLVYENNTLGFPNYSNDDSYLVFDAMDENGTPVMGRIPLAENKLEAAGDADFPYVDAQWTTWFSQGTREINSAENDLLSFEILHGDSTIAGTIAGQDIAVTIPDTVDITRLVAQFQQSSGASVYIGDFRQISGITSNNFSEVITYTVIAENGSEANYAVNVTVETTSDPGDPNNPDDVVGIENEIITSTWVYPNPFEKEITIDARLAEKPEQVTLFNVLGQSFTLQKQGDKFVAPEQLSSGLYILSLMDGNKRKTVRLLKK